MKKEVKNIFNQSYQQHDSDVDPADIWEAIEFKKKKKSRKGIVWLLFGSSIFILAFLAYQFGDTGTESSLTVSEAVIENTQDLTSLSANTKIEATSNTSTQNTKPITEKNNIIDQKNSPQQNLKENIESSIETKIIKENNDVKNQTPKTPRIKSETSREVIVNHSSEVIDPSQSKGQNSKSNNNANQSSTNPNNLKATKTHTNIVSNNSQVESGEVITPSLVALKRVEPLNGISSFITYPLSHVPCSLSLSSSRKIMLVEEHDESEKSEENTSLKFSFAAIGLAGIFKDSYRDGETEYLNLRSSSETALESFGTQLSFITQWKNFGIETGINYLRTNRIMQSSVKYFGDEQGNFLYEHDPNKINPTLIMDSQDSASIYFYERTLRKYNETHTVSIPLNLSYSYSLKSIDMGLYAGALFHFVQKNNSDVFAADRNLIDQRLDNVDIKRRPDLTAGIFLDYRIKEKISLTSRLGYRHRKTIESALTKQTSFYTVGLGLKYHID